MAKKIETAAEEEKRYTVAALMRDKRFSHIQKDFLRAILKKPLYTIQEAEKAVSHFCEKE